MVSIWFSSFAVALRYSRIAGSSASPSSVSEIALDELHADLALQTVDEVRQPRLCVAHDLRRFGKAAEVDGCHQNFKFFAVHIPTPIKGILICNIPIITERFSFSSAGCNIFNTKELIIP